MTKLTLDDLENEELLRELYLDKECSLNDIADMVGCTNSAVLYWLQKFGIPTRPKHVSGSDHASWKGGYKDHYGENWADMRESTLERDDYRCRSCGMANHKHNEIHDCSLHVHHIVPIAEFEDKNRANALNNLITLCRSCHASYEGLPIDNRAAVP